MTNTTATAKPVRAAKRNADSVTARAREWVLARKPYEVFWLHEVPGDTRITSELMSRIVKNSKNTGVTCLARRFYMKGEWFPPSPENGSPEGFWYLHPSDTKARIYIIARYLGDSYNGLGLARYDALSVLRWTTQCPMATELAIAGKKKLPVCPLPEQVYMSHRSNQRRAELTMAENTIIEAARFSHIFQESYKWRIGLFKRPAYALGRMKWYMPKEMIVVRPEALAWAMETEHGQHPRVKKIVHGVAETLKDDVVYNDIVK